MKPSNINNNARLDEVFELRRELWGPNAESALHSLYGHRQDFPKILTRIFSAVREAYANRPETLKALDLRRSRDPAWFRRSDRIAYAAYVDRFAGTLQGVEKKIDYLKELGISYLHLLPVLKMRPGHNDGGFAVSNYRDVEPRFGSNEDLTRLANRLRENDISLCLDFVLNHTSDDHEWAKRARRGDDFYKQFYFFFPDRDAPDRYERTVKDVFVDTAPGSFTFVSELNEWVWTTFHPYQWDLNYSNPLVFEEMLKSLLFLANRGVEIFRVDAAPYIWKRLGTDCLNQPEVFSIIRALRVLTAIAAPGILLKAEAVVPSYKLVRYLGAVEYAGEECQLAYNTTLMTMLWSALAEGNAVRLVKVLKTIPNLPYGAAWLNYVRCHDDIGWCVLLDETAGYTRDEWRAHAAFLQDFYSGAIDGSFATGEKYQASATVGAAASLCGLEKALAADDVHAIDLAVKRLLALYTVAFSYGGTPLINMGDEIGQLNDDEYESREDCCDDKRWLHRGPFDWAKAALRNGNGIEARLFSGMQELAVIRSSTPQLSQSTAMSGTNGDGRVLTLHHRNAHGALLVCVNFSSEPARVEIPQVSLWRDRLSGEIVKGPWIELGAYGRLWLTPAEEAALQ